MVGIITKTDITRAYAGEVPSSTIADAFMTSKDLICVKADTQTDDIAELIEGRLPRIPRRCGQELPRHRLVSPTEGTDVMAPDGTKVHFDVSLDDSGKIKSLTRVPIIQGENGYR